MTTALAVREVSLNTWETIKAIAPTIRTSGMFGVPNEAAAAAVMLKGYELGLGLTAAFEFIHIIEGKPSLSPRGAFAIVQQSGLLEEFEIVEVTEPVVKCTVTMKRKGGIKYTASWSLDDAKKADLVKDKSNWHKYPANMCKWRAMGYCMDMVFADITGGLKRSDEFGADLTPSGDVIEGSWTVAPVSQPVIKASDPEYQSRLSALLEEFPVANVMQANGNKMPKTVEEIDAVSKYLAVQSVPMTPEEFNALEPLPN